ncbi:hypothetical protein [Novosphingobium olei]|uniref:Uncharacterized protein n=1 Tax=Novosphingobium olei TaxID=2728851 RepID=A0A7Y0BSK4_9SPHN|nr:hypothetical protein [Novosphingobium olei]NML95638.1 hypothetical protein [Novosphingobium olei]
MKPETRAMIAASAYALIFGKKVAGVHDHASGVDLDIAAEAREGRVQAVDGARSVRFAGTLPEVRDSSTGAYISFELDGTTARGFDRATSSHFSLRAQDQIVQLYDHGQEAWFAFSIQTI